MEGVYNSFRRFKGARCGYWVMSIPLLLVFVLMPMRATAQSSVGNANIKSAPSLDDRKAQYNAEKKDPGTAAIAGFVIPLWGASLAGNSKNGIVPQAGQVLGVLLMFSGRMGKGYMLEFASEVAGAAVDYKTAQSYNMMLANKHHVDVSLAPPVQGKGLGFQVSISTN